MQRPRRLPKIRGLALAALAAVVVTPLSPRSAVAADMAACTVANVTSGLGTFNRTILPSGCWRPYGDTSPFNQVLPAAPKLAANSAAIVRRVVAFGNPDNLVAGNADTVNDYWHPTYYSLPTDPVFRLHCYEASWGTCEIEGEEIRVPDAARRAGGGDGHLTVVDQLAGWEYDLYKVRSKPAGGGTLEFRWGGRTRIDGDGLGAGATAAGVGSLAGIIRAQELEAGRIDHALFMVVTCDSGQKVYPAGGQGRSCAQIGLPNDNAPPMGTRFQLGMSSSQIDALPVPAWKKTILRAMARYGMYFADTGSGGWGIQMESGSTYTSFGREDRMVGFARSAGVPLYNGKYVFNLRDGVDWAKYLRVIDTCVTLATCASEAEPPPPAPSPTSNPPPEVSPTPPPPSTAPAPTTTTTTPTTPRTPTTKAPKPPAKSSPSVKLRVRISGSGARGVTASGSVPRTRQGVVKLTTRYAAKGRRFKRVDSRKAKLRHGRFTAKVSDFRHGRWQVTAVLSGAAPPAVDAHSRRLDRDGGSGSPPPVNDGRHGLGAGEAPGTKADEPLARAVDESQLGSALEPGPLAGGGYLGRGIGTARAIRSVQRMLSDAGHRTRIDGRFGVATEAAVRRFQQRHGLLVDGLVGRQTMGALRDGHGGR